MSHYVGTALNMALNQDTRVVLFLLYSTREVHKKLDIFSEKHNIPDTYLSSIVIQKLMYKSEKPSGIINIHHPLGQLRHVFSLATDMTCSQTL